MVFPNNIQCILKSTISKRISSTKNQTEVYILIKQKFNYYTINVEIIELDCIILRLDILYSM